VLFRLVQHSGADLADNPPFTARIALLPVNIPAGLEISDHPAPPPLIVTGHTTMVKLPQC